MPMPEVSKSELSERLKRACRKLGIAQTVPDALKQREVREATARRALTKAVKDLLRSNAKLERNFELFRKSMSVDFFDAVKRERDEIARIKARLNFKGLRGVKIIGTKSILKEVEGADVLVEVTQELLKGRFRDMLNDEKRGKSKMTNAAKMLMVRLTGGKALILLTGKGKKMEEGNGNVPSK